MKINELRKLVKAAIKEALKENAPAPAPSKPKPSEKPGPAVAPGKPDTGKPKPRRPLGDPGKMPETTPAKAGLKEEEILRKIVARFKSKK